MSIVQTDGQTQTTEWNLDSARDAGYRLTAVTVASASYNVAHDADGRVVEAFGQKQYFDPLGRLAFVTDLSSNVIESYLYDGQGRLVAVNDHTVTPSAPDPTVFVYGGEQIASAFEEVGGAWAQKFHAVWGPGQDNLIEFYDQQNGETMQVVKDHRNSVVAARLVTQAGAIPDRVKYTPEGRKIVTGTNACDETSSATTVCEGPSGMPFGFNAMWTSSKTGYVYMRNRWYAPRLGEFLSQDPMGFVDSYNLYGHVSFDPINRWDPWGLDDTTVAAWQRIREMGVSSARISEAANRVVRIPIGGTRMVRGTVFHAPDSLFEESVQWYADTLTEELTHAVTADPLREEQTEKLMKELEEYYASDESVEDPWYLANEAVAAYAAEKVQVYVDLYVRLESWEEGVVPSKQALDKALEDYRKAMRKLRIKALGYEKKGKQVDFDQSEGIKTPSLPLPRKVQQWVDEDLLSNSVPDEPRRSPFLWEKIRNLKRGIAE